ncbi:cytochrome P450 reductase, partial [Tanacetum coccineum]
AFYNEAIERYEKVQFKVIDVDDYAVDDDEYTERLKRETYALFFFSTYGDGEPTDNAARFFKWFTEGEDRGIWLRQLQYGVFGCGNKQYEHFNKVARVLDEKLAEQEHARLHILLVVIGVLNLATRCKTEQGKRLFQLARNDDHLIEDDFVAWKELVWPELDRLLRDRNDKTTPTPYAATIPEYRRCISTRKNHCQPVLVEPIYETGDHIGVLCENQIEVVEAAEGLLGLAPDTYFALHDTKENGAPLSGPTLPPPFLACT